MEINIHISGEGWKSTKVEKWGKIDISKEGRKMSEKWKIKRVKNALQWPLVVKVHEVSNKNGKILGGIL